MVMAIVGEVSRPRRRKQIKHLFREFEPAGERATKTKCSIVEQIIEALTVRTYPENEVLYPEIRRVVAAGARRCTSDVSVGRAAALTEAPTSSGRLGF